MKIVFLSEKDRAILKGCAIASVVGKSSIDETRALFNANDKIEISTAIQDIEKASAERKQYQLDDAEVKALKGMFLTGKESLRQSQPVLEAMLNCHDHLEDAKPMPSEAKKEADECGAGKPA